MPPPGSAPPASAWRARDARDQPATRWRLRSAAARDPKAAIKEAAKQFEALFMQELMKSMRQATMASGMLDNEGTQARHRDARHPVRRPR